MAKVKGQAAVEKAAAQLETLSVEYVEIDWVKPNSYNPNRQSDHEFQLLLRSIKDDGMTQPVLCMQDGTIVDGEHRWRACKQLGYTRIPIVKVNMTEAQRRVATIRHNTARGSHDIELEAQVLRDLQKLGAIEWAQDALQLTDVEMDRMLNDIKPIDEYGAGDTFSDSWEYAANGSEGGADTSAAAQNALNTARELTQAGMKSADVELVKQSVTLTRSQVNTLNQATGGKSADTIMAMAEAHVEAKNRAGKGEWTTLTFVVPTSALLAIEQELARLSGLAPNRQPGLTIELQRGLALEFMAILSAQTPDGSLT